MKMIGKLPVFLLAVLPVWRQGWPACRVECGLAGISSGTRARGVLWELVRGAGRMFGARFWRMEGPRWKEPGRLHQLCQGGRTGEERL